MPYMRLNGRDITKYIEMNGFNLSENDLDSPKSGRVLSGLMQRGKVAEKLKAEIKLVPVKKEVIDWMIPILRNQYFTCDTDLFAGQGRLSLEMYNSTRKYGVAVIDTDGDVWYIGVSFNIIQR